MKRSKIKLEEITDVENCKRAIIHASKTTIRKSIFLRLTRLMRRLWKGYNIHRAYAFMSYRGYLKHTDSESVRRNYINGKINLSKIKEIIRNESRKYCTGGKLAAAV